MAEQALTVPVVDCLVLDDGPPHLAGNRCDGCGATFLDRHNACARCGGQEFSRVRLPDTGRIHSFTVLVRGAPKHIGPFVSVLVQLDDGTFVKANLVGVEPEADAVDTDRPVRVTTYPAGTDEDGNAAVAFGFAYDTEEAGDRE